MTIRRKLGCPDDSHHGDVSSLKITPSCSRVACNVAWALVRCWALWNHMVQYPLFSNINFLSHCKSLGAFFARQFRVLLLVVSTKTVCVLWKVYPDSSHGQNLCRSNTLKDVPMEIGGPSSGAIWIKPMDTYGPSPSATPEPKIIVKIPVTSTVQRRNPQSPGDLGWEVPNFISAAACSILRTSMNERSSVYQRIWSCSKRRYTVYPNHGNFGQEADFRTIMCFWNSW